MNQNENQVAITPVTAFEQLSEGRKLSTLKSGTKVSGLLTKKAYAEANGLKGSATINRAYDKYVREAGAKNRTTAAALMASADVIVRKFKVSADGSRFSIEGALAEKPALNLEAASEDDVGSLIDRLRELAPTLEIGKFVKSETIEVAAAPAK